MSDFNCKEAIELFEKLPKKQMNTGWVSNNIARCYFELTNYPKAEGMYQKMVTQEPYRLEGLEYYSTTLWHLKKQVELCHLSNYALERNMQCPETWCILGNNYSLQMEHEMALKFFTRAIQQDAYFFYA